MFNIIGLTGGIASGKSAVAATLRSLGAYVADADAISRRVVETPAVLNRIVSEFGRSVLIDGVLDRAMLAKTAFATKDGAAKLNAITHPTILQELLCEIDSAKASGRYAAVFADAPLLIESGLVSYCESVWLVIANMDTRIRRIINRDRITEDQALLRIGLQLTDAEKLPYANIVIQNNGSYDELVLATKSAFNTLLR